MHESVGALEDDGVCELNVASIAVRFDADAQLDVGDAADDAAQRQRRLLAYPVEVAEAHRED